MAHRKLFPPPGSDFLSPSDIVARLRSHFRHVQVDSQGGQTHLDKMVDQLTRMQFLTPPPATPEQIDRLRRVRAEAVLGAFADDPASEDTWLSTAMIPGEPLFFGFSSARHQEAAGALLERCAIVLGYEMATG